MSSPQYTNVRGFADGCGNGFIPRPIRPARAFARDLDFDHDPDGSRTDMNSL
jgi:hypothetical protein